MDRRPQDRRLRVSEHDSVHEARCCASRRPGSYEGGRAVEARLTLDRCEREADRMTRTAGFIDRHRLWTDAQRQAADELEARVERDGVKLVRLAWADPHGASRAKMLTVPAFLSALK